MGYRDDFYVDDNIIGYTSDLQRDPTVYYRSEGPDGITVSKKLRS